MTRRRQGDGRSREALTIRDGYIKKKQQQAQPTLRAHNEIAGPNRAIQQMVLCSAGVEELLHLEHFVTQTCSLEEIEFFGGMEHVALGLLDSFL